ncbi:MAG: MBL fold metallo-hydrolase, partial [Gemmatimonadaceae bacterium]|nr:MBL fold metallo-hydrolase [Acetobacteraceae bacterium]
GAPMAMGAQVPVVQRLWAAIYGLADLACDGSQWDRLLTEGEAIRIGELEAGFLLCPGHSPCAVTISVGDTALVHDTLFQPDSGSARTDFPGGDAGQMWDSMQRILALPPGTRLFTGHDYRPGGRPGAWESTVAAQQAGNLHAGLDRDAYIAMREARDQTLPMPRLILPALQVNIRGGRMPPPDADGRSYLRIPIGAL